MLVRMLGQPEAKMGGTKAPTMEWSSQVGCPM